MTDEWTYTNEHMLWDLRSTEMLMALPAMPQTVREDYRAAAAMLHDAILERMNGGGNEVGTEWYSEITNRVSVSRDMPRNPLIS
jgi:hypothetical protein